MSNLSDNELDKLSREAAEKFEPAEDAQSWNRLEQLLDKNLGKPSPVPKLIRPGIPLIYSGAILLVIGLSYYLIKTKKDNQNSTLKNFTLKSQPAENKTLRTDSATLVLSDKKDQKGNAGNTNDVDATTGNKSEFGINKIDKEDKTERTKSSVARQLNAANKDGNKGEKANNSEIATGDISIKKSASIKPAAGKFQRVVNGDEGSPSVNSQKPNAGKDKNGNDKTIEKQSSSEDRESGNSLANNTIHRSRSTPNDKKYQQTNTNKKDKGEDHDAITNPVPFVKNDASVPQPENENLRFADIPSIVLGDNGVTPINDSSLRSFNSKTQISNVIKPGKRYYHAAFVDRSLQIGVLFAPEFSKVKYIYDNNRLGNSFGITLGYQLSGKLSLNSGIIISKKYYQANDKQFHGPQNAAGTNNDIEFVNASANVIDIPLNIRFNYFTDGNSTFFVNGGLSSYLMKKEDFDYYCHYYNNNGGFQVQAARWVPQPEAPPSKNNLFSIINLSTGFETAINNSFSFQFEPYMKLPLKGVGFGKVDLSSYGIIFSLKYSPVLKRGRH